MRVLFLGDSITEGKLGVSYVPKVDIKDSENSLVNRGVGGDTVSSLYSRVLKMKDLPSFDYIVVFIGVNDVFGKMSNTYKVLKLLRRQLWAKDSSVFKDHYNNLITHIKEKNKNIIIISPLLIGEDLSNKWNNELSGINNVIYDISKTNNLIYLDVYAQYKKYLSGKLISDYLPIKLLSIYKDSKTLTTTSLVDQKSNERGLHLTLDGVHLNTLGANILSKTITEYFEKL